MGRHTQIYMLDKVKSSTFLYEDLKNKTFNNKTFESFINDRKTEFESLGYLSFDKILQTINEDINFITSSELFEITYFIDQEILNSDFFDNKKQDVTYKKYGLELLYDIGSSATCYSYMFQYGNFTHYFPINELPDTTSYYDYGYSGRNIDANDFLKFNDYMILMMKRILDSEICLSNDYITDFDAKEKIIVAEVVEKHKNNKVLLEVIENEFNYLKTYWDKQDEHSRSPEINTIWSACQFLSISIQMKQIINQKINTRIVIVDSI